MSKKSDRYYFDNFICCADLALQTATLLQATFHAYRPEQLEQKIAEIHEVEHTADTKKHEMMETLAKAFITPIEREDILSLSQNIDNVTDAIEDVMLRVYTNNAAVIREEAVRFTDVIVHCCEALKDLLTEFQDFKRSKKIKDLIVKINELEEKGDKLFISSMRILHSVSVDPLEIITWREIYVYLEKCCDACEHVADVVESVIMKNT